MRRHINLLSFVFMVFLFVGTVQSECVARILQPSAKSYECTVIPAADQYSPTDLGLIGNVNSYSVGMWFKPGTYPAKNVYYRVFRTSPQLSNHTNQRTGLFSVPLGYPSLIMNYWTTNEFQASTLTYPLYANAWYFTYGGVDYDAGVVSFNLYDPSTATGTSATLPEAIDQELYLTSYMMDEPLTMDWLQIGSDGNYRGACSQIKEVIFIAGWYSFLDYKTYLRWGLMPQYLSYWQFSEGYGQKAIDTKGPRNLTLGTSYLPDTHDPVWETSLLDGINLNATGQYLTTATHNLSLIDSETYFTPTFDFIIRPWSVGPNTTIFQQGNVSIQIDESLSVSLFINGNQAKFTGGGPIKLNDWNKIVVWCSNRYRKTIYCESQLNGQYNGFYIYPKTVTYKDNVTAPLTIGALKNGFLGDARHFKISVGRAGVFLPPCADPAFPCFANNSLGCYYFSSYKATETICPEGTYFDNSSSHCTMCNIVCKQCKLTIGENTTSCTNCTTGEPDPIDGSCPVPAILPTTPPPCPLNCTNCDENGVCKECNSTYHLTPDGHCAPCPDGCDNCTNTTCKECSPGYTMVNGSCLPCSDNCTNCTANGTCTGCDPGYHLQSDGSCSPCDPNCSSCDETNNCTGCMEGHTLVDGVCKPCPENCSNCTADGHCTECEPGSSLDPSGKCTPCPEGCDACNTTTGNCSECSPGYYLNITTQKCEPCMPNCSNCTAGYCIECDPGYHVDIMTGNCTPCKDENCAHCTKDGDCILCDQGYYVKDGNCTPCPENCTSCNATGFCKECDPGLKVANNGTCIECPPNCTACDGDGNCTNCTGNLTIAFNGTCISCPPNCTACDGNGHCINCTEGTYVGPDGTCLPCPENCTACDGNGNCTNCTGNLTIAFNGTCISCPPNCTTCDGNGNCTNCTEGTYVGPDGICLPCPENCTSCDGNGSCTNCTEGNYASSNGSCVPCPENCNSCDNNGSCTNCTDDLFPANNGTCIKCPPNCTTCDGDGNCTNCTEGTYMGAEGYCVPCPENCTSCDGNGNCTNCTGDLFPANNGTCIKCPPNCTDCDGNGNCTNCTEGTYIGVDGYCVPCPENCSSCDGNGNCTNCTGDLFPANNGTCIKCPPNCTDCDGDGNCTNCTQGTYIGAEGYCIPCAENCSSCADGNGTCTNCSIGFFLSENATCLPCPKNCDTCESNTTCTNCTQGFYASHGTCVPCPLHCLECDNNGICTNCMEGYECNVCSSGQYKASNGSCLPCTGNCSNCTGENECTGCKDGSYLSNGQCTSCPMNCSSCIDENTCSGCNTGSFLSPNGSCIPCPVGCDSCESSGSCSKCAEGTFLLDGQCYSSCPDLYQPTPDGKCEDPYALSESELDAVKIIAWSVQSTKWVAMTTSIISFLLTAGSRGYMIYAIILFGVCSYFNNFNTYYPANLRLYYKIINGADVIFVNLFNIWSRPTETKLEEHEILFPRKCRECKDSTVFLEKYGDVLSLAMVLVFMLIICEVLRTFVFCLTRIRKANMKYAFPKTIKTLRWFIGILKYNLVILFVLGYVMRMATGIVNSLTYLDTSTGYVSFSVVAAHFAVVGLGMFLLELFLYATKLSDAPGIRARASILLNEFKDSSPGRMMPLMSFLRALAMVLVLNMILNPYIQVFLVGLAFFSILILLHRDGIYKKSYWRTFYIIVEKALLTVIGYQLLLAFNDDFRYLNRDQFIALGWMAIISSVAAMEALCWIMIKESFDIISDFYFRKILKRPPGSSRRDEEMELLNQILREEEASRNREAIDQNRRGVLDDGPALQDPDQRLSSQGQSPQANLEGNGEANNGGGSVLGRENVPEDLSRPVSSEGIALRHEESKSQNGN